MNCKFGVVISVFFLFCIFTEVPFNNCTCILPRGKIVDIFSKDKIPDIEAQYGGKDGYVYIMNDTIVFVVLICNSFTSVPIDLQYIAEETPTITDPFTKVFHVNNMYNINAYKILRLGINFSQHYCFHVENPCGYVEYTFTTTNNTFMGRVQHHPNVAVPPLKRNLPNTTDVSLEMLTKDSCTFTFFTQLGIDGSVRGVNCTVKYFERINLGTISLTTARTAVDVEAHLRDRTTDSGCIHFLKHDEECVGCQIIKEKLPFPPKVMKCNFGRYNAQQFIFSSSEEVDGKYIMHTSWAQMNPAQMFLMEAPDVIYAGRRSEISCKYSMFVFAQTETLAFRRKSNGSWKYVKGIQNDTAYATQSSLTFVEEDVIYSDFYEVMCIGTVWNSTEQVNKTKIIRIERLQQPGFLINYEDVVMYENEDGKLSCKVSTFPGNVTYKWTMAKEGLPTQIILENHGSFLVFINLSEMMGGIYYCDAINLEGTARKTFNLSVERRPEYTWVWILTILITTLIIIFLSICGIYYLRKSKGLKRVPMKHELQIIQSIPSPSSENENSVWKSRQPFQISCMEPIGIGSFGSVYRIMHTSLKKEFALKKIHMYTALRKLGWEIGHVFREMENYLDLNNDHIVKFYNCWIEDPSGLCNFEFEKLQMQEWTASEDFYIFIQLELCDSSLANWLETNETFEKRTSEENIQNIFYQIMEGLKALHLKNIIHRDIKPNNILYKIHGNGKKIWKIGDLGLSKKVTEEVFQTKEKGCSLYRSPEMGGSKYTSKTDIFSLGLTFLEVTVPFASMEDKARMFDNLRRNQFSLKEKLEDLVLPMTLQKELKLIELMLQLDPENRISLDCEHVKLFKMG